MAIGTTAAILGSAAIAGGTSLIAANQQSRAAGRAIDASQQASDASLQLQREMFDRIWNAGENQRQIGNSALQMVARSYGITLPQQPPPAAGTHGPGGSPNVTGNLAWTQAGGNNVGGSQGGANRFLHGQWEGAGRNPAQPEPVTLPRTDTAVLSDGADRGGLMAPMMTTAHNANALAKPGPAGTLAAPLNPNVTPLINGGPNAPAVDTSQPLINGGPGDGVPGGGGGTNALADFFASPDYQFRLQQGLSGITGNAAARGMLQSGATLKGITDYSGNLAAGELGNWRNGLFNLAGLGQVATNQGANAGQNFANAFTNTQMQNAANLGSSYMNQGNAWAQGIGGIGGALGWALNNFGR